MNRVFSDSTPLYANDKISHTDVTFSLTPSAMMAQGYRHCLSMRTTPPLRDHRSGISTRACYRYKWQESQDVCHLLLREHLFRQSRY